MFDDMARVASGAAGAFGGIRSRVEGELRDKVERLLAHMNLVTREEHEVVAAMAQKARTEQEILTERMAALEARLAQKRSKPANTLASAKTAKPKPAPRRQG